METTHPTIDQRTTNRYRLFHLVSISVVATLLTCCTLACTGADNPDLTANQPEPIRKINFDINLNDVTYESLKTKGGYVIVNDIIVAQTNDGQYLAFSAKCTHEGTRLVYKPVENQFYCPLDLSRFDAKGVVAAGPATRSLQQYLIVAEPTAGVLRVSN